jgi:multidrug resistance efflux pump
MRRFIAAPYDGILQQTLVQYGDVVEKDQVLATMDGRQLRIRLSGLRAEYNGAKKRRDSSLAKSDYADAQIALTEMNRLDAEIELLDQQVVNLEIRSPIDGIIVSGDLEKVEGAPLEMGQTLYEVGPLSEMLAEVAIPEAEIQYVSAGMPVAIKLDSFPFQTWHGEIQKIHPRTELVDNQSVFIAQVKMNNDDLRLRPGLKGTAKIRSDAYPLGWNLFHHAWETVRYWTIW